MMEKLKLQFEIVFFLFYRSSNNNNNMKIKEKPIGCETEHEKSRATQHMQRKMNSTDQPKNNTDCDGEENRCIGRTQKKCCIYTDVRMPIPIQLNLHTHSLAVTTTLPAKRAKYKFADTLSFFSVCRFDTGDSN